jgi:hypothetical protein
MRESETGGRLMRDIKRRRRTTYVTPLVNHCTLARTESEVCDASGVRRKRGEQLVKLSSHLKPPTNRLTYLVKAGVGSAGQEAVKLHKQLEVDIVGLQHTIKSVQRTIPNQASVGWLGPRRSDKREGCTHLRRLSVSTTGVVGVQVDTFNVQKPKVSFLGSIYSYQDPVRLTRGWNTRGRSM